MRYHEIISEGKLIVTNQKGWKYEILPPKAPGTTYTMISMAPNQDIEHQMEFENLQRLSAFLKQNNLKWIKNS